jgi:hypothetical protein
LDVAPKASPRERQRILNSETFNQRVIEPTPQSCQAVHADAELEKMVNKQEKRLRMRAGVLRRRPKSAVLPPHRRGADASERPAYWPSPESKTKPRDPNHSFPPQSSAPRSPKRSDPSANARLHKEKVHKLLGILREDEKAYIDKYLATGAASPKAELRQGGARKRKMHRAVPAHRESARWSYKTYPGSKEWSEQHDRLDGEGFTRANKIANLLASKDDRLRHGQRKAPVPSFSPEAIAAAALAGHYTKIRGKTCGWLTARELNDEREGKRKKKREEQRRWTKLLSAYCIGTLLETVLVPAKEKTDRTRSRRQPVAGSRYERAIALADEALTTAGMVLAMPPEPVSQDDFEMQRERLDRLCDYAVDAADAAAKEGSTLGDGDDDGKFIFFEDPDAVLGRTLITAAQRGDTTTVAAVVRLHGKSGLSTALQARTSCGKYSALAEAVLGGHGKIAEELVAAGAWDHSYKSGNLSSARRSNVVGKKLEPDLIAVAKIMERRDLVDLLTMASNKVPEVKLSRLSSGKSVQIVTRRGLAEASRVSMQRLRESRMQRLRESRMRKKEASSNAGQSAERSRERNPRPTSPVSKADIEVYGVTRQTTTSSVVQNKMQAREYAKAVRSRHRAAHRTASRRKREDEKRLAREEEEYIEKLAKEYGSRHRIRSRRAPGRAQSASLIRRQRRDTSSAPDSDRNFFDFAKLPRRAKQPPSGLDRANANLSGAMSEHSLLLRELHDLERQSSRDSKEVRMLQEKVAKSHGGSITDTSSDPRGKAKTILHEAVFAEAESRAIKEARAAREKEEAHMRAQLLARAEAKRRFAKLEVELTTQAAEIERRKAEVHQMAEEVAVAQRNARLARGKARALALQASVREEEIKRKVWADANAELLKVAAFSPSAKSLQRSTDLVRQQKRSLVGGIDMDACAFCGTRNCTHVHH